MPAVKVEKFDTFESWRVKTNEVSSKLETLITTVNENDSNNSLKIGDLNSLETTNKADLVSAINYLLSEIRRIELLIP